MSSTSPVTPSETPAAQTGVGESPQILSRLESTVEIVSDSGEGAQKCGQIFGSVSAKMGNGVWTVEIIPAEIQPPARSPAGASGNRIRIGKETITNWGDQANVVIAFNEQVLLSRHRLDALADDAILLIEDMWAEHEDEAIRQEWKEGMEELATANYRIIPVPMEKLCLTLVDNARKGKNMFALGVLSWIYERDLERIKAQIAHQFRTKSDEIIQTNIGLLELGVTWAQENLDVRVEVPTHRSETPMVVMNGNEAIGMGAIASGMDYMAMYPITPATSVSHYLAEVFHKAGGTVHQAEDEIAAVGCAIGASFAGKVAFTVTSGPGMALKTEFLGLAIMTEMPLVVVDVQRGGPSTGLPTKVEQADLLSTLYGQPGDAPKVILAPATIEECFHSMITARKMAEALRTVVVVLTDANLATGVQPYPRPQLDSRWQAREPDLNAVPKDRKPYQWDRDTGLSRRFVPGQPEGMFVATGLSHSEASKVSYVASTNELGMNMRSRKLAVLQSTLQRPEVVGEDSGDMLVVGWGSTKGAIEEAVERARSEGLKVSSTHLTFLSPLQPGLKEIFSRFKKVMTVEINYSDKPDDPYITDESRRLSQLCWLLRAHTLVDIDCWSRCYGEPLQPRHIVDGIKKRMQEGGE